MFNARIIGKLNATRDKMQFLNAKEAGCCSYNWVLFLLFYRLLQPTCGF
jgi:hypothetical protein